MELHLSEQRQARLSRSLWKTVPVSSGVDRGQTYHEGGHHRMWGFLRWTVLLRGTREQGGAQQGRVRTPIVWGQGIPLRPSMTIRRPAAATTSGPDHKCDHRCRIEYPSGLSSSLQRERDLALRRIDELHVHYKRELKKKDNQGYIRLNADLAKSKQQVEQAQSLIETQKLSIKLLQEEQGDKVKKLVRLGLKTAAV